MPELILYNQYTRKQVRDIMEPDANYTPGAGSWGIAGVINIGGSFDHFVFFVTYGREQAGHVFEEGISEQGILNWQSQPKQHLEEKRVKTWINQSENNCLISLFVRNDKNAPFIYLGNLTYVDHDLKKERPVWFTFQIDNWRFLPQLHRSINPRTEEIKSRSSVTSYNEPEVRKSSHSSQSVSSIYLQELLDKHPEILGVEEGKELHFDYETTMNSVIPLVVHCPGKEKYVVSITQSTHDVEVFNEIGKLLKLAVDLSIELGKSIDTLDFKRILFVPRGNYPVAKALAKKYRVVLTEV